MGFHLESSTDFANFFVHFWRIFFWCCCYCSHGVFWKWIFWEPLKIKIRSINLSGVLNKARCLSRHSEHQQMVTWETLTEVYASMGVMFGCFIFIVAEQLHISITIFSVLEKEKATVKRDMCLQWVLTFSKLTVSAMSCSTCKSIKLKTL